VTRQLVQELAILQRIANSKQKSTGAIFLPRTTVSNGAMKTPKNNFKGRDETLKTYLSSLSICNGGEDALHR